MFSSVDPSMPVRIRGLHAQAVRCRDKIETIRVGRGAYPRVVNGRVCFEKSTHTHTHTHTYIYIYPSHFQEDGRRMYYLAGMVWTSLIKDYLREGDSRVVDSIKSMFISPKEAKARKLPVEEVSKK